MERRAFMGILAGACLGVPCAVEAQQETKVSRIGFLALLPGEDKTTAMKALLERVRDLGYVEGKNLTFEYREVKNN